MNSRSLIIISRLLEQVGKYQVSELETSTRRGDGDETLLRYSLNNNNGVVSVVDDEDRIWEKGTYLSDFRDLPELAAPFSHSRSEAVTPSLPRHGSSGLLIITPGYLPTGSLDLVSRLDDGSRMSGDVHVQFCESLGVKFPTATHPVRGTMTTLS